MSAAMPLADVAVSPSPSDQKEAVRRQIPSQRNREVFAAVAMGKSHAEAAAEFGLTQPRVTQIVRQVREWRMQVTGGELGECNEVERLRPFHHWTTETVRERFDYTENAGISLAFLRVWKVEPAWTFPHQPRFGGCRSWLDLPEVPRDLTLSPVLNDTDHAAQFTAVRAALALP